VTGTIYISHATAQQAQIAALNAYTILGGLSPTSNLSGTDLGGLTLTPGVYKFDTSAGLTGALTLDAQNNPDALFVFQIGSTLTTASASVVNVINGGANNGIYWQVGSGATLGTSTVFAGNILAQQAVSLTTTAKILCGRAISLYAAVTMDTNTLSNNNTEYYGPPEYYDRLDWGSKGFSGGFNGGTTVPEPGTFLLFGTGLAGLWYVRRSKKNKKTSQPE
jgi:type VI secretion system secreted protein VgrG